MDDEYQPRKRQIANVLGNLGSVTQVIEGDGVRKPFSSWRFLVITLGGIFLAEAIAMIFIYGISYFPYYLQILIDASMMMVLIFPLIYYFSLRPLLLYIEKHQRLENALRQSEERFALAYRSNPAALSIVRIEDGCFVDVNESFLRRSGYSRDEVIGHTTEDLRLYPNPEEREKLEWLLIKQRRVEDFEMTTRIKTGELRNILVSTEAIELGGEINILAIASDITERKQAMELVKRERQRHYDVLESLPAYLVLLTDDYQVSFSNLFFRERFGENQGRRCYEHLFGRSEPCEACETYKVLNTRAASRWEWAGPDGHIYDVSNHPFTDMDGSTLILQIGIDITEQKHVEEELRKMYDQLELRVQERTQELVVTNDELLKEIKEREWAEVQLTDAMSRLEAHIDNSPLAVAEFDPEFRMIRWSKGAERIFGWKADEVVGHSISEMRWVYEEDTETVFNISSDMLSGKSRRNLNVNRNYRKDGTVIHCEWYNSALYDAQGQLTSILAQVLDITERARAEDTLRESEEKYTLLFEKAAIAASMTKLPENVFVDVNEAFEKLIGYSKGEVAGRTSLELGIVRPEDYTDTITEVYQQGFQYNAEKHIFTKSGEERIILSNINVLEFGGKRYLLSTMQDITESKRAEDALRLSEMDLKNAQEVARIGNWKWNLESGEIIWSDEMYRIFGIDKHSYTGRLGDVIASVIHPDDLHLVLPSNAPSLAEKKPIEYRIILPDRSTRNIWAKSGESIVDNSGKPLFLTGIAQDITERKRMEEALRLSEERFRLALKNAPVTVAMQDNDLRFIWAYNQRTVDPLAVVGKTDYDLFPPEYASKLIELKRQVLETGVEVQEQLWVSSGGCQLYLGLYLDPMRDDDGKIIGVGIATVDLTERKQAEEDLQKAHDDLELRVNERTEELAAVNRELLKEIVERKEVESRLRIQTTAMEAAANGILITDHRGVIEWVNPALTQSTGYESSELLGQTTRIFNSGKQDANYYRQMWDTILSGRVWRGETINRRKDGSLYVEDQTITPVRDEHGKIPHFIAIKQDITERKQAEAKLAERNIELQALSIAEHEQRQLSEALVKAALVLNKSMKLDEVLPLILEQIKEVIPYQLANIAMLDGESFYDASRRGDQRWSKALIGINNRFPLEDFSLLTKMCQTGQPLLISDIQKEPNWVPANGLEWCRSYLSAPLVTENQVIGFVNLFSEQSYFFTIEMQDRLVAFASHAAVAIQNAWLFDQVRAGSDRLQSLSHRLVEVQENERLYISRELHDEAGQMLTSLILDLRTLETQVHQPEVILGKVAEMEKAINAISENLHSVAMRLRPASLDHLGLVPALRQHVESIGEKYGLKASFRSGKFKERLSASVETELYRIVQEVLTNVVRHAHATRVDVILTTREKKLIVIVEDDGDGFNPKEIQNSGHLGLFGIQERTEMIGGQLMIESSPGKGTSIILEINYVDSIVDRRRS